MGLQDECIQVCFSVHDGTGEYTKYLGVALVSMLRNTMASMMIHIIHDDSLNELNKLKLEQIASTYGQKIYFHPITMDEGEFKNNDTKRHTIGTLFRLKICDVIDKSITRIIYLDADVVVNLDIKTLWNEDLEGKAIGGVVPLKFNVKMPICECGMVTYNDYINAGVLLIDLDKIRDMDFYDACSMFLKKYPELCRSLDQDAINYVCKDEICKLDMRYNTSSVFARQNTEWDENRIYHFYADCPRDTFDYVPDRLFFEFFLLTPWGTIDSIVNHYEKRLMQKDMEKETVYSLAKKVFSSQVEKIVFWGVGGAIHHMIMERLPCNENTYFVDSDARYWGQKHMGRIIYPPEKLKEEKKGDLLIIVTIFRYKEVKSVLEKYGYEENVDFYNGKYLLRERTLYELSGERDCKWDL
ncbi:MAG: glycosyltransferase family 8 protein [Lachnospiraceae bacterium]|nr:glycosyltransferase family 8 protein [Lachnospiraceae bacterium]